MRIDIECLTDGTRGRLEQGRWGDNVKTACLMSALTGRTDIDGCVAEGWPRWLAELGQAVFDNAPRDIALERATEFAQAVKAAVERGADFDEVFRAFRLDSVLPIALESIGEGDEAWRVECQRAVNWAIENGGLKYDAEEGAEEAAQAAWAAWGTTAAGATWAAAAAWEAGVTWTSASSATWDAVQTRLYESICKCLRGYVVLLT